MAGNCEECVYYDYDEEEDQFCDDENNQPAEKKPHKLRGNGRNHRRQSGARRKIVDFADVFDDDVFDKSGQTYAFQSRFDAARGNVHIEAGPFEKGPLELTGKRTLRTEQGREQSHRRRSERKRENQRHQGRDEPEKTLDKAVNVCYYNDNDYHY